MNLTILLAFQYFLKCSFVFETVCVVFICADTMLTSVNAPVSTTLRSVPTFMTCDCCYNALHTRSHSVLRVEVAVHRATSTSCPTWCTWLSMSWTREWVEGRGVCHLYVRRVSREWVEGRVSREWVEGRGVCHLCCFCPILYRTRVYQREEKALNNILSASRDKWVQMSYEVSIQFLAWYHPSSVMMSVVFFIFQMEGPLHAAMLTLFVQSLAQWEESRLTLLRQLIILAHARNASSTPVKQWALTNTHKLPHCDAILHCLRTFCRLPSAEVAAYSVYKPVLVFFGVVDGLHRFLKVRYGAAAIL